MSDIRNRIVALSIFVSAIASVSLNAAVAADLVAQDPNPTTAPGTAAAPPAPAIAPVTVGDALVKAGAIPLTSNTIADVAAKVAPAVVNIEVNKSVEQHGMSMMDLPPGLPPGFEYFFNQRMFPQGGGGNGHQQKITRHAIGSGFIVRPDGYIVTNAHVVRGQTTIKVTLNDKRVFDGKVVGTDGFSDLAVVKIDANNLPTVGMGTSKDLRPGEFAIAIGSPLGFDHSVSLGIISAVSRTIMDVNGNINFIQTDAAINLGNSGGPLLNLAGEVIGVNTFIYAHAQNIGFSIPVDIAKSVVNELIEHKGINRPWLGIVMQNLDGNLTKSLGIPPSTKGVMIAKIVSNSPALASGLVPGDIIEKIDGKDIADSKEVVEYVKTHKVQETLHMLVLRNNTLKPMPVIIGQYPDRPVTGHDDGDED
jgi:S1-C subfamily serine protease